MPVEEKWELPAGQDGAQAGPAAAEPPMLRWGLVFYGVMALAAWLWRGVLYGEPVLYAPGAIPLDPARLARDLAIGLAAGGLLLWVTRVVTGATGWGERLARALAGALRGLSLRDALILAGASGLAEEMFFRGALQPRVGWLAASVLFGLVHFVPRRDFLPWTVFAILAGVLFGALFEWTGNLVAPVVAHVLVNAVNLPFLLRRYA